MLSIARAFQRESDRFRQRQRSPFRLGGCQCRFSQRVGLWWGLL
jgi:hypothetical protein